MSADAYFVIVCDGPPGGEPCGAETHSPTRVTTHAALRSLRRPDGWRTRRRAEGGPLLDLCPDCARRPRRPVPSARVPAALADIGRDRHHRIDSRHPLADLEITP
ncbi:hypothetical protein [Streptomyces albidoflavus]|uniref:hypothetical protein n=1 Tax=Streptomyces albidoflavus TaxID=1886 RepID=UPI0010219112|nr:hypothetical protein [Streptomyces albidoflavus]RZF02913.1 hypothetical protein C0R05_32395 [Streptomyces albidoflavus]